MKNKKDAFFWIKHLKLIKHPEGGYFREVYRSKEIISANDLPERFSGDRNFSTTIFYLLRSGEFSAFHKIKSDEIWHFYEGSQLILHVISPEGKYKKIILGRNANEGEKLQYAIPYNHWLAAEVKNKKSFSLMGCTVSPGFDFIDFVLGSKKELLRFFPQHAEIISRLTW